MPSVVLLGDCSVWSLFRWSGAARVGVAVHAALRPDIGLGKQHISSSTSRLDGIKAMEIVQLHSLACTYNLDRI